MAFSATSVNIYEHRPCVQKCATAFVLATSLAFKAFHRFNIETNASPEVRFFELSRFAPSAKRHRCNFPAGGEFGWGKELRWGVSMLGHNDAQRTFFSLLVTRGLQRLGVTVANQSDAICGNVCAARSARYFE